MSFDLETSLSDPVDRAWASGLFDGEGTTYLAKIQGGKYTSLRLYLSPKNQGPELLLKLQQALQVGLVKERVDRPQVWVWVCYARNDSLFALRSMWSHLGTAKKAQAIECLSEKELSYVTRSDKACGPTHLSV